MYKFINCEKLPEQHGLFREFCYTGIIQTALKAFRKGENFPIDLLGIVAVGKVCSLLDDDKRIPGTIAVPLYESKEFF